MRTGIDDDAFKPQMDPRAWPELKRKLAAKIRTKTRDEWCQAMEGTDVCFAPVLDMNEAPLHPHNQARQTFVDINGVTQPAPAPRFSRTAAAVQSPPAAVGEHSEAILREWGFSDDRLAGLKTRGIV
jgi:alpha-methylacyl-CoA racemase